MLSTTQRRRPMTNRRWILCHRCDEWQPVREDETDVDYTGTVFQLCEFCETESGPFPIWIRDGANEYDYDESELTKEELEQYEQRTDRRK
jgi:hypothetical protein